MMFVLRPFFQEHQLMILQGRRRPNPPDPVGYKRDLMTAQEARQRLDSKQNSQVKLGFKKMRPSPARFVSPGMGVEATALSPTKQRDFPITKEARVKPAVPIINPRDGFRDNNKCIVNDSLSLNNNSTQSEMKPVRWHGINSSISSSPGFQNWAEKFAMLTGEKK